ncbi:hypothetical protein LT336_00740 [Spiroplasma sp. JKS002671]|uniref:hypothetical protein n=1 Tax=Spiroplasma attinicola TaxID=2904537 RepID=UPI002022B689|nr:hypothetical protein [Spiroplasma sp. JKS002671]MCL8210988.1 hypothetical protein [Spiroplasma sp. JKS002671]
MKKRGHYWLIIAGSFLLSGTIVGTLTATILTSDKVHYWNINPYQKYDFNKVKNTLLKAEIAPELVNQYLELTKKITGVIKTNEIIKASELLTLDNKIMNSISQRIIWNNENTYQVQSKIDLVKPILMQFYQYYDYIYVKQNNLQNDSLNNMQLKSSNTDLYKWSIGATISDYSLIKNYLTSAQKAWISKMSMSYILQTFLNKKIVLYDSLINQTNDEITNINQQIATLLGNKNQLLITKIDAQNHKILVSKMLSAINSWWSNLTFWYGLTMETSITQLAMEWFPPVAWALVPIAIGFSAKYADTEKRANKDLNLQTNDILEWFDKAEQISHGLEIIFNAIKEGLKFIGEIFAQAFIHAMEIAAEAIGWIMAFAGMAFLTANYTIQTNTLLNARTKIGNPNSDVSNAISDYINDLDNQMNDISITVKNLNIKENNYINQKISFNNKLNDLSKQNQFFKDFNTMNNQTFIETNLFTTTQTENWQKEVQKKYGYLTENSATTDDFITAFTNERNNFNNKYLNTQNQEQQFINNYNNNDKEYFIKSLLSYIDNPLKNNLTYFNDLNLNWNNYDDILKG